MVVADQSHGPFDLKGPPCTEALPKFFNKGSFGQLMQIRFTGTLTLGLMREVLRYLIAQFGHQRFLANRHQMT